MTMPDDSHCTSQPVDIDYLRAVEDLKIVRGQLKAGLAKVESLMRVLKQVKPATAIQETTTAS